MQLRLHMTQRDITALGPGRRFGVWVQGCKRRCPGCISPETWSLDGGYEVSVSELAQEIVRSGLEGITISGGEPFLQADALTRLIQMVRRERDVGVIIYTGNRLEELTAPEEQALLSECDLLVDGTYEEALNDGKNLRGSSNQRAIALTQRYEQEAAEYGTKPTQVEFFFHEDKIVMVGIPTGEWIKRAKKLSQQEGG